jgi:RND family efflux transporter MFP subunit
MKLRNTLTLALTISFAAAGCGPEAPAEASESAVRVETAPVVDAGALATLRTAGRLTDRASIPLAFAIGGVVGEVAVGNGDTVDQGRLLARLDLAEIDARVARATAAFEKAERDLARARRLFADSVLTRTALDDTRTARDVAAADLQAARFARENAEILAPAAGRITARRVEPGQVVSAGRTVVELGEAGWRFRAGLADRDVVRVGIGMAGTATFRAFPGAAFPARVVEIAGAADPATGTFLVELAVTDPEARLRSGMIGAATIEVPMDEALASVPIDALVGVATSVGDALGSDGGAANVFVVEGGVARLTEVSIVRLESGRALVRDVFAEGARVVTTGAGFVSDGDAVLEGRLR